MTQNELKSEETSVKSEYFWSSPSSDITGLFNTRVSCRNLSNTKRYSGFSFPDSIKRQSVAEHVLGCLQLYQQIESKADADFVYTYSCNGVVKYLILNHDNGEAFTGDIPYHLKTKADDHKEIMHMERSNPEYHRIALENPKAVTILSCIDILECAVYTTECRLKGFSMVVHESTLSSRELHARAIEIAYDKIEALKLISLNVYTIFRDVLKSLESQELPPATFTSESRMA